MKKVINMKLPEPFLGPGSRGGGFQLAELCRVTLVPPEASVLTGSAENNFA